MPWLLLPAYSQNTQNANALIEGEQPEDCTKPFYT
jgi:hypothetical protein